VRWAANTESIVLRRNRFLPGVRSSGFYINANDCPRSTDSPSRDAHRRTKYGAGIVDCPQKCQARISSTTSSRITFPDSSSPITAQPIRASFSTNFFKDNFNPADTTGFQNAGNDNRSIYTDGGRFRGQTDECPDRRERVFSTAHFPPGPGWRPPFDLECYTAGEQSKHQHHQQHDGWRRQRGVDGNQRHRPHRQREPSSRTSGITGSGVLRDEGNVVNATVGI